MDQKNKGSNPSITNVSDKRVELLKFRCSDTNPMPDCTASVNAPKKYCCVTVIAADLFEISVNETKKYLQLVDAEVVSGPEYSEEEFYGEKIPYFNK